MTLDVITAQDFSKELADAINDRDASLDTRIGDISNLFVTPVARVCERQSNRAVYISNLSSLMYVDKLRIEDVDELIYNEGMVRWSGSRAVTTVTFSRAQPPTSDILVPLNLPLATVTDPNTGQSVVFRTVEAKTMYTAAASGYFNPDTERYELSVAVASVTTGAGNDIGAYSLTIMRRPVPGFDEVFNPAATQSGSGIETNEEVASRYLLHVKGSQLDTPTGTERSLRDNFSSVEDVYVVYGDDAYLTRERTDAGAVDVWVKGSSPIDATYLVAYPGIDTLIPFPNQPLMSVTSVFDGVTYFTEGTDYEVVTGEGIYSYSNGGVDGIRFISGGTVPTIGAILTITYKYNALISILNSYYTQPMYYTMGMDKLFRWAQPKYLEMDVALKINAGNPDTVTKNVRTAIETFVNDLGLGDNVEEFDLDREVGKLYGVDNLVWNQLSIAGGTGVADIEVGPNEYAYVLVGALNVSLV